MAASSTSATEVCCRYCFNEIDDGSGVSPCDCMEDGILTVAHQACVQHWINLRPNVVAAGKGAELGKCEVCGSAWKQKYEIPEAPQEAQMTQAERDERAQLLLISAYVRVQGLGGLRPRADDAIILHLLGPHYDGPWRKKPSLIKQLADRGKRLFRKGQAAPSQVNTPPST